MEVKTSYETHTIVIISYRSERFTSIFPFRGKTLKKREPFLRKPSST